MKGSEGVGSAASCSDLLGRPFYFELHLHLALITELWVEKSRKREIFDFQQDLGYQSYDLYSSSRKKKIGGEFPFTFFAWLRIFLCLYMHILTG